MSHHEHDPEMVPCADCGSTFDLARQHYYDNRCPDCVPDDQLKQSCAICGDREMPGDLRGAISRGRRGSERIQVCSEGCKVRAQTEPWAPHAPSVVPGENKFGADGD